MRFNASTEGASRLGLCEVIERFANDLWIPGHLTSEQAVEFVLDCFDRTMANERKMLEVSLAE